MPDGAPSTTDDAVTSRTGGGPQEGLFDLPPGSRRPTARVVLLTGPSGAGKTSLTRRMGLPVVSLDDFYLDGDHPALPRRYGVVDWDSPATWDRAGALDALLRLSSTGQAELPVYDIPTNRRTGTTQLSLDGFPVFIAEGIFAAEIVEACREEDILADALCIWRPRAQTFWFRLMRDLGESRKPPMTLVRRGLSLYRNEPVMIADLTAKGARKVRVDEAEARIEDLLRAAATEERPVPAGPGGYRVETGRPSPETYRALRSACGLSPRGEDAAVAGLAGTWHGVVVRHGAEVVGMGRVVGDGGSFFQLVDVCVLPAHQGRGLGGQVVAALLAHLREHAPAGAYVSLVAEPHAAGLYRRHGFAETAPALGMALTL